MQRNKQAIAALKRSLTPQVVMLIGLALVLGLAAGYYFGYDVGYEKAIGNINRGK